MSHWKEGNDKRSKEGRKRGLMKEGNRGGMRKERDGGVTEENLR